MKSTAPAGSTTIYSKHHFPYTPYFNLRFDSFPCSATYYGFQKHLSNNNEWQQNQVKHFMVCSEETTVDASTCIELYAQYRD